MSGAATLGTKRRAREGGDGREAALPASPEPAQLWATAPTQPLSRPSRGSARPSRSAWITWKLTEGKVREESLESGWLQCECWLDVPQGTHGRGHRSRLQILCD